MVVKAITQMLIALKIVIKSRIEVGVLYFLFSRRISKINIERIF